MNCRMHALGEDKGIGGRMNAERDDIDMVINQ